MPTKRTVSLKRVSQGSFPSSLRILFVIPYLNQYGHVQANLQNPTNPELHRRSVRNEICTFENIPARPHHYHMDAAKRFTFMHHAMFLFAKCHEEKCFAGDNSSSLHDHITCTCHPRKYKAPDLTTTTLNKKQRADRTVELKSSFIYVSLNALEPKIYTKVSSTANENF